MSGVRCPICGRPLTIRHNVRLGFGDGFCDNCLVSFYAIGHDLGMVITEVEATTKRLARQIWGGTHNGSQ